MVVFFYFGCNYLVCNFTCEKSKFFGGNAQRFCQYGYTSYNVIRMSVHNEIRTFACTKFLAVRG